MVGMLFSIPVAKMKLAMRLSLGRPVQVPAALDRGSACSAG
jgi:hypothetical protein